MLTPTHGPAASFLAHCGLVLDDQDDSAAAVVCFRSDNDPDPDIIIAETLMATVLLRDCHSQDFVRSNDGECLKLCDLRGEFEQWLVSVPCGPQDLSVSFSTACMQLGGYYGMVFQWNLRELYTNLALTCHQGHRWVWVSRCFDQWRKALAAMWPLHADASSKCSEPAEGSGQPQLPLPAASTPALLALLLRFWASPAKQAGALVQEKNRMAARTLLEGLIDLLRGRSFRLRLLFDDGVELRWRRPPAGDHPVVWLVSAESMVDFSGGLAWATAGRISTRWRCDEPKHSGWTYGNLRA